MSSLVVQRYATPMNGSIRDASGILMMPAFDCVSQRDLRESTRRRWVTPFAASFGTHDDRFVSVPASSRVIRRTCSHLYYKQRNEIRTITDIIAYIYKIKYHLHF